MIITLGKESIIHPNEYYQKDNFIYLPMQKNASTWGKEFFTKIKWDKILYTNKENYEQSLVGKDIIIFLREPINRWYSAVAQYFDLQEYIIKDQEYILDKKLLDLIFSAVRIDNHSDLQIKWLLGLCLNKCTFFNIDDPLFEYSLHRFLHKNSLITTLEPLSKFKPTHTTETHIMKTSIIAQLKEQTKNNSHYLGSVTYFNSPDIEFFNWLKANDLFFKIEEYHHHYQVGHHVSSKLKQSTKK